MSRTEQIHARLTGPATAKATSFFNATLQERLFELFQNARQAGAKTIHIETADDGTMSVRDDGCGIARPELVLSFGQSGWSTETVHGEHTWGMSLFGLARDGAVVRTRPVGGQAWRAALGSENFLEGVPATVVREDQPVLGESGTQVTFPHVSGHVELTESRHLSVVLVRRSVLQVKSPNNNN